MKKKYIVCLVSFFAVYGCTADRSWNFRTDYLSVDIDRKGYITSMKNVTVFPARETGPLRCCPCMIVEKRCTTIHSRLIMTKRTMF